MPYVRAIMDAQGPAYTCVPHREGPQPGHRPHWVLETQGVSRSALWLAALVPYLHTKRAQAEEMLVYCHENPCPTPRIAASTKARIREL